MPKHLDSSPTTLVTHTAVYPDRQEEFALIQTKINNELERFPGYISHTILPPDPPVQNDWVIMQQFSSTNAAKEWLQSDIRQSFLNEMAPFLMGSDDVYFLKKDELVKNSVATIIILNKVRPEYENEFIKWNSKIAAVQSKFAGFIGCKLERPKAGIQDVWVTILSFDSDEHLKTWLNSKEREKLLRESKKFSTITHSRMMYSGFDFWFGLPLKGSMTSIWKENMLVLLALYPIVFLYRLIIDVPIMSKIFSWWLSSFISCTISVTILATLAVPFLRNRFTWWLDGQKEVSSFSSILGAACVILLYLLLMFIFSKIA